MHSKELLLDEFYTTIDRRQLKVETRSHGKDYIGTMWSAGEFDFGEYKNGVYKYRLSGVEPDRFTEFLEEHVEKKINLCVYFHIEKNNLFAINLDSTVKQGAEIKVMALYIAECMMKLGLPPLVIKSGHGYHFWCRICEPVENCRLQALMNALIKDAVQRLRAKGLKSENLQCICYPRPKASDISIRLFGSEHIISGRFSSVVTGINTEDTVLGEEESWRYFENYMNECTAAKARVEKALDDITNMKSLDRTD